MRLDDASYAATLLALLARLPEPAMVPSGSWQRLAAQLATRIGSLEVKRDLLAWGRMAKGVVELEQVSWEQLERAHQIRQTTRKANGVFYTPAALMRRVTDDAFALLGPSPRVLDPSCGTGTFLRAAAARGARVYGVDRDEHAVAVARAGLAATGVHGYVACGDFLTASLPTEPFDLVIGNPPYVRYHALDAETIASLHQRFTTATGQFDLFGPMIEHSLSMLRPGGVLAFVLPSLFLRGPRYQTLRRVILDGADVVQITEHGDGVFEGVQAPVCHVVLVKKPHARDAVTSYERSDGVIERVDTARWREDPSCVFGRGVALRGRALGTMARIRRGYPAGRKHAAWADDGVQCVAGSDIEAFRVRQVRRLDPAVGGWSPELGRAEGTRVLVRETGDRLIACVAPSGVHITRTLYAVWPEGIDCYTLCALLNSESAQQWYRDWCRPETGIFPKLRMTQLRSFPIPELADEQASELAELARQVEQGDVAAEAEIHTIVAELYLSLA